MNWSFMNSELQLPLDATLYELKERLRAKHGAMTSLKVDTLIFFWAVSDARHNSEDLVSELLTGVQR